MTLYHVRQYRPAYFSGFENQVVRDITYDDILKKPEWLQSFQSDDFTNFSIEPYGNELIIIAHYRNGKYWVAAFAINVNHPFAKDWRYTPHVS
jgi:hypothetical protein